MRAEKIFKLAKDPRSREEHDPRRAQPRGEGAAVLVPGPKAKKREFRELWIQQINAATREHGVKYSEFMHGFKEENVAVDRKILAELADGTVLFKALVDQVKRMKGIVYALRIAYHRHYIKALCVSFRDRPRVPRDQP